MLTVEEATWPWEAIPSAKHKLEQPDLRAALIGDICIDNDKISEASACPKHELIDGEPTIMILRSSLGFYKIDHSELIMHPLLKIIFFLKVE